MIFQLFLKCLDLSVLKTGVTSMISELKKPLISKPTLIKLINIAENGVPKKMEFATFENQIKAVKNKEYLSDEIMTFIMKT